MKEGWAEGLAKECPECKTSNKPWYGKVIRSNEIVLSYKCLVCGHVYTRRDAPDPKIEVWNSPGRPGK